MRDLGNVTVQDCMDMWTHKGRRAVINDGKVAGFENGSRSRDDGEMQDGTEGRKTT